MSAPTSTTSPSFVEAKRIAIDLVRDLERITDASTFDDVAPIVASAKRLVTKINGTRYKLAGAPRMPRESGVDGRATLSQERVSSSGSTL